MNTSHPKPVLPDIAPAQGEVGIRVFDLIAEKELAAEIIDQAVRAHWATLGNGDRDYVAIANLLPIQGIEPISMACINPIDAPASALLISHA